jgi:hypothetical protein
LGLKPCISCLSYLDEPYSFHFISEILLNIYICKRYGVLKWNPKAVAEGVGLVVVEQTIAQLVGKLRSKVILNIYQRLKKYLNIK